MNISTVHRTSGGCPVNIVGNKGGAYFMERRPGVIVLVPGCQDRQCSERFSLGFSSTVCRRITVLYMRLCLCQRDIT